MSLEQRGLHSLASKVYNRVAREPVRAVLWLTTGEEICGTVYLLPGVRLLDLLNLPGDHFIAVTDARISRAGSTQDLDFVAVNKTQIVTASQPSTGLDDV
jgi:hypothetical protein